MSLRSVAKGILILSIACVAWGASFPVIKVVMSYVDVYTYLWVRSSIALAALTPFVAMSALRKGKAVTRRCVVGGLATGIAYTAGLGLQAVGTHLTEASRAAFITGFTTVFVHAYASMVERAYSHELGAALALSIAGLYLMTKPSGGLSFGDALILLSAVAWAAQVVLVSRYSECNPMTFVFFENVPPVAAFLPLDYALTGGPHGLTSVSLAGLSFLGIACSVAAFALQVVGQRLVDAATAAVVYQTEPVYAALIAHAMLGESMSLIECVGASLILAATILAGVGSARLASTHASTKALRK